MCDGSANTEGNNDGSSGVIRPIKLDEENTTVDGGAKEIGVDRNFGCKEDGKVFSETQDAISDRDIIRQVKDDNASSSVLSERDSEDLNSSTANVSSVRNNSYPAAINELERKEPRNVSPV